MIALLALPGGWIADRLLGARRAVLWGGLVRGGTYGLTGAGAPFGAPALLPPAANCRASPTR